MKNRNRLPAFGAGNILSAPLAQTLDKDGAVTFGLIGLSEILAGGIIGAASVQKALIVSPDFPQKGIRRKSGLSINSRPLYLNCSVL